MLISDLHGIAAHPEFCGKRPGIDFSRRRKLPIEDLLKFFLFRERDVLSRELYKFFDSCTDPPSSSAYCQQIKKLRPDVFHNLLVSFNSHFRPSLYRDKYILTAVDGTAFSMYHNPEDPESFSVNSTSPQGFNQKYVVASYLVQDRVYTDAVFSSFDDKNEYSAVCDMLDRCDTQHGIPLFLADRGFPSYNLFAHAKEKGCCFLIRAKKRFVEQLLGHALPDPQEFDVSVHRILARSQAKKLRSHPDNPEIYRHVHQDVRFDFLPKGSKGEYPIDLRVVLVKIPAPENAVGKAPKDDSLSGARTLDDDEDSHEESFEYLVTNLPKEEFSPAELCGLYHLRWSIETSFRELKHDVGAIDLHGKSNDLVTLELWARMLLYNFSSRIMALANINKTKGKHDYQLNRSMAIKLCHDFIRRRPRDPPMDLLGLIEKYVLPIRPGRCFPRPIRNQPPMSFGYRH